MNRTQIKKNQSQTQPKPTYSKVTSDLPMCTRLIHSNDGLLTRFGNWISQRNLLTELTDLAVLAGGALLWEFDEFHPETGDLDFFVLNNNKVAFREIITRICSYYGVNIVSIFSKVEEHCICTITINSHLTFQIILTNHTTPREVVENFDMDYIKIYHYQGVTEANNGAIEAMTTHKIDNINRFRLHRVLKAIKKGFKVPQIQHLLDRQYLSKIINKPRPAANQKNISLQEMMILPLKPFDYQYYDTYYASEDIVPQFERINRSKNKTRQCQWEVLRVKMPLQWQFSEYLPVKIKLTYKHPDSDNCSKQMILVEFNRQDELIKHLFEKYPPTIPEKYQDRQTIKCLIDPDIASGMECDNFYRVNMRVVFYKSNYENEEHTNYHIKELCHEITEEEFTTPYF